MNKSISLGTFLRTARDQKQLSLRDVERATDISNAYLSQIEGNKIKQPSPNILHKLCEIYEVSYNDALQLAGFPVPTDDPETGQRIGLKPTIGPITEEEEKALIEYLAFLRSRHSR